MLLPTLTFVLAIGCGAGSAAREPVVPIQERNPAGEAGQPGPGSALIVFGNDTVRAEVASTPGQRSQGLMGRPSVPAGTGMLFVFPDEEVRSFWMRNTLVSLDIAFMDSQFRIVDIQRMEALSEDFTDSRYAARYALEVPEGWFAAHGVRVGDRAVVVFGE
jgi:uncharacterized membrane protein (UPF0127 family)